VIDHPEVTFFVNDEMLVVHAGSLTVGEILDSAGFVPDDHVLVEHHHSGDRVFEDLAESVPLRAELRLQTRAGKKIHHIVVNGRPREVAHDVLTYDEVVQLAPNMCDTLQVVRAVLKRRCCLNTSEDALRGIIDRQP
jgi:hypothetical protein